MNTLKTAILLTLTVFGAWACDSNPVPHPGQNDKDHEADVYTPGTVSGEADAFTPAPGRGESDNDDENPSDFGNGAMEPCAPDVAPAGGVDAGDAGDDRDASDDSDVSDDNATDAGEVDCGPSETQAPPPNADQDQVEE